MNNSKLETAWNLGIIINAKLEEKSLHYLFIYYLLLLLQPISGFSFLVNSISCILTVTLTALFPAQG